MEIQGFYCKLFRVHGGSKAAEIFHLFHQIRKHTVRHALYQYGHLLFSADQRYGSSVGRTCPQQRQAGGKRKYEQRDLSGQRDKDDQSGSPQPVSGKDSRAFYKG